MNPVAVRASASRSRSASIVRPTLLIVPPFTCVTAAWHFRRLSGIATADKRRDRRSAGDPDAHSTRSPRVVPLEVALDGADDVLGADGGEDVERVLGAGELGV